MAEFGNPEVIEEEVDILLIGGGMACCGTAFEIPRWIEASGATLKLNWLIKLLWTVLVLLLKVCLLSTLTLVLNRILLTMLVWFLTT